MMSKKIVIAANAAWNLSNFRTGLIEALVAAGYDVIAVAPPDSRAEQRLAATGCRFVTVPVDSKGLSIRRDLATLRAFGRLFRRERPACFLGFTVKPNIYGSIAASWAKIPVINNISGLGTAFIARNWLTFVVKLLYRWSLRSSRTVFFQNEADRRQFLDAGLVRSDQARLLPGSGVDLERFRPDDRAAPDAREASPTFLMIARLVRDKGVREFVDAAHILRARGFAGRFQLLGFLDVENRTAIRRDEVERWNAAGDIDYLGATEDVRPSIAAADCIVLPSYREGTSHVLLEAAAMAKPIIATDVPGCREAIDDGSNGYLCAPRNAASLADVITRFAALSPNERIAMGQAGRHKMLREFDERIVVSRYLERIALAC